jgi:rhodanese-related sulfurtransferase
MTAHLRLSALSLIVMFGIGAHASEGQRPEEDRSSPPLRVEWAEFKKLYDAKKIEVVDVRVTDAFKAGRIPGARSVPEEDIAKKAGDLKKLTKEIITYCACPSEDSSVRAAQTLRKHGVEARALVGGYHKWLQVEGRAER